VGMSFRLVRAVPSHRPRVSKGRLARKKAPTRSPKTMPARLIVMNLARDSARRPRRGRNYFGCIAFGLRQPTSTKGFA
jgi:hypothetical protein